MVITASYDARYAHQYDQLPTKQMSDLRWDFLSSHVPLRAGSRVLDIGYGNGAFLRRARTAGMDVNGIELHGEDFGVPVVGFDCKVEFDLISFFDSLEHFADFEPIFKMRARNVIVSIPCTPAIFLRAPGSWRHFKPGEHMHYFSSTSLDTFMSNWGFLRKLAEGYPEDALRGKLLIKGSTIDNIYTAIYARK